MYTLRPPALYTRNHPPASSFRAAPAPYALSQFLCSSQLELYGLKHTETLTDEHKPHHTIGNSKLFPLSYLTVPPEVASAVPRDSPSLSLSHGYFEIPLRKNAMFLGF